eukprot:scaffold10571_cov154-Cylindrotheca_fusiformis.AAC.17
MFKPKAKGKFQLRQVLGTLNAKIIENKEDLVERFRARDFYGKRFFLSSHPLGQKRPKDMCSPLRCCPDEQPSQKAKKKAEEAENRPVNIRVIEARNEIIYGCKFGVLGLEGQFQVLSTGRSLTKEDEKAYWGEISYDIDGSEEGRDSANSDSNDASHSRLVVRGSVLYGYGLEPHPVGRFIMTETTHSSDIFPEDEEDESQGDLDCSNAFQ